MVLTERIREKLGHAKTVALEMAIFDVTELATAANVITAASIGFSFIEISTYHPTVSKLSIDAVSLAGMMTTNRGLSVTITARTSDAGSITALGW